MLVLMVFFMGTIAMGQKLQEVVYLKNGSVIRGVIIEQIPNVSLKVQTADGSIFAYKMEEVEKITKEQVVTRYNSRSQSAASNQYALKTGYRGFVDVGYSLGVGKWGKGDNRIEFSTSHGYQALPCLFAGIGAGVHYYYNGDVVEIPIFADIRGTLPCRSICQPFLDFKIGYTVYDATGFYMNPSIGCRFAVGKNCGIHVGVGYVMQKIEINYYYISYAYSRYSLNDGAVTFKVGFDF